MSDQKYEVSQFDWSNVLQTDPQNASAITPEQAAADWQACHDQEFPAVFEAEDRARAKAYANEHGLALTLEYIKRLERIAFAGIAVWIGSSHDPKQKELWAALKAVNLFEDEDL